MLSVLILALAVLGGHFCCGADMNEAMAYEIMFTSTNESEYCVPCGLFIYVKINVLIKDIFITELTYNIARHFI
jgi:hypothetical protein